MISNSRNKIHKTWGPSFSRPLYMYASNRLQLPNNLALHVTPSRTISRFEKEVGFTKPFNQSSWFDATLERYGGHYKEADRASRQASKQPLCRLALSFIAGLFPPLPAIVQLTCFLGWSGRAGEERRMHFWDRRRGRCSTEVAGGP